MTQRKRTMPSLSKTERHILRAVVDWGGIAFDRGRLTAAILQLEKRKLAYVVLIHRHCGGQKFVAAYFVKATTAGAQVMALLDHGEPP